MPEEPNLQRRSFLTGAAIGGAAATALGATALPAAAQTAPAPVPVPAPVVPVSTASPGYTLLTPDEAAFVEAMVDTMVPADQYSPKGTDIGINTYIDRAITSGWGRGDRLYRQGPWAEGTANQGYQAPLPPGDLYRVGIAAANAVCRDRFGKSFDQISNAERNTFLTELDQGKVTFPNGPSAKLWWGIVYQTVMEGMFSDPVHGGNHGKAGWKLVGFPGVIENNRNNIGAYLNKRYAPDPISIADMS